ncbi:hypothetical protein PWG14_07740 (plasmid) [Chromobacterium amazonense]|uniref:hypothetical protein n=1 Tax=Chromobacterium amazonense TaxID=1382803 RepID=UPI00237E1517|nr:hypothetical protein [Chromobacterium amazonense]MDE1712590.1 hypothetical protein [Chromobacterium amazonense]
MKKMEKIGEKIHCDALAADLLPDRYRRAMARRARRLNRVVAHVGQFGQLVVTIDSRRPSCCLRCLIKDLACFSAGSLAGCKPGAESRAVDVATILTVVYHYKSSDSNVALH